MHIYAPSASSPQLCVKNTHTTHCIKISQKTKVIAPFSKSINPSQFAEIVHCTDQTINSPFQRNTCYLPCKAFTWYFTDQAVLSGNNWHSIVLVQELLYLTNCYQRVPISNNCYCELLPVVSGFSIIGPLQFLVYIKTYI